MKRLLLLTLVAGGAACSDQPLTTEPSAQPGVTPKAVLASQRGDVQANLIADALDRILPALGESDGALAARNGLQSLEASLSARDEAGLRAAFPALENALSRIERDEPGHAANVVAIRLAIAGL